MPDRYASRLFTGALLWLLLAAPVPPTADAAAADDAATAGSSAEAPRRASGAPTGVGGGGAEAPDKTRFLRYVDDPKSPRLEAAIVTYRNADDVRVHLVSAVHVGEKKYYDGLAETFRGYDALLYEMVKPKAMSAPVRGQKSGGMVSGFQRFLKDVLELEFQLDAIDYGAANFVHADLDAETFARLQEERGESLFSLMLQSMMNQMARAGQPGAPAPITVFDLLAAMNSPDSARQYKLLLARQFQDVEAQVASLEGPDGSVLLTERNKAALRVLGETIAAGRRNVGVFYGAAHMQGLEDALVNEMGFERVGVEWRVAWDMTPREPATRPATRPGPKALGEGAAGRQRPSRGPARHGEPARTE